MTATSEANSSLMSELDCIVLKLTDIIKEISDIERAKANAVALYRHGELESCIRREQASILKLRGAEEKRLECMKALGWEDLPLSRLLPLLSSGQNQALVLHLKLLKEAVGALQENRADAERILKVRLHTLQTAAGRGNGEEAGTASSLPPLHSGRYV